MTSIDQVATSQGPAAQICEALRHAILERALKPGTKLPEDTLGESFGVSRTIARHALGQLAAEGLVELKRNRGASVAKPGWEEARDLFDIRKGLERVVMARLSGRLTTAQIKILREHVKAEEYARGQGDAVAIRLATEFHLLLVEMTQSPVLVRYVREVCLRCGLTLALHGGPHSTDCAIKEHLAIIEALRSGDTGRTISCMDEHLESVAGRALVAPAVGAEPDLLETLARYAKK